MAALACWLAACSSGGGSGAAAYSQRFGDGGACPASSAPALPAGSGCVTSVAADLDGDGRPDRFVVYAKPSGKNPATWWAEAMVGDSQTPPVRLSTGLQVGGSAGIYPRVAGAAEANGDPGDEVFVQLSANVYHGAAPPVDAIYGVRGGRVVPAVSGGKPFLFSTGGVSRFGNGARCETVGGAHVLVLTTVTIEPYGWKWFEHTYRWDGLGLVPDGTRSGRLPRALISDPRVYRNYQLICGGLRMSQVTSSYPPPP